MLIKQHKSGQATLVLIVVTMVTVLGIAVASSSQSRINLRDTVYSTQSVQALGCAEAGADRALITEEVENDEVTFTTPITLTSAGATYAVEGCDGYDVRVTSYPAASGQPVTIPNIPENTVQELNTQGFVNNRIVRFRSNIDDQDAGLAIYRYHDDQVTREVHFCDDPDVAGGSPGGDIHSVSPVASQTITLDDGTVIADVCQVTVAYGSDPDSNVVTRVRPIYADTIFQMQNFTNPTGARITSVGSSGQIQRSANVLKFFSQLSGAFDEAVVTNNDIVDE